MISIVIPLYNKEKLIANTLNSVFKQTFQNFEIIIINDGSTDNSVSEVEKIKDKRIRIIHQQNAGVSSARNRGIQEAKFDLIAFLDADDEWRPTYLETQYDLYLKYPECSVFACNYEFKDHTNRVTPTTINRLLYSTTDAVITNYFEIASFSNPPLWTSAVMVKKSAILSVGGFLLNATLGEDLLAWSKLACKYQIAYSNKVMAIYNFRSQKELVNPRRSPDKTDLIGKELNKLSQQYTIPYLRDYIGLWHKMRFTTFIRLGMRKDAQKEFAKLKKFTVPDYKIYFWVVLNFLPHKLKKNILFLVAKFRE